MAATVKDYRIKLTADAKDAMSALDLLVDKVKSVTGGMTKDIQAQGAAARADAIQTKAVQLKQLDDLSARTKKQTTEEIQASADRTVKRVAAEEAYFAAQKRLREAAVKEAGTDGILQIGATKARLAAEADLAAANIKKLEALRDDRLAKVAGNAEQEYKTRVMFEQKITAATITEAKKRDDASEAFATKGMARLQKAARFGEDVTTIIGGNLSQANFSGLGATIGETIGGPLGAGIGLAVGAGIDLAKSAWNAAMNAFDPGRIFTRATAEAAAFSTAAAGIGTTLQGIGQAGGQGDIGKGFALAKSQAEALKATMPEIANNMLMLLNMPGGQTEASLAAVTKQLENIQGLAKAEALKKQMEAADSAIGAATKSLVGLVQEADKDVFSKNTTSIQEEQAELAELQAQFEAGAIGQIQFSEKKFAIDTEIREKELAGAAIQDGYTAAIKAQLAVKEQVLGRALTEQEVAAVTAAAQEKIGAQIQLANEYANTQLLTEEQLLDVVTRAKDEYAASNSEQSKRAELAFQAIPAYEQASDLLNQQLDTMIAQGQTEEEKQAVETAGLMIKQAQLVQVAAELDGQIAAIKAAIAAQGNSVEAENKRIEAAHILGQSQQRIKDIIAGTAKDMGALQQVQAKDLSGALKAVEAERVKVGKAIETTGKQIAGAAKAAGGGGGGPSGGKGGGAGGGAGRSQVDRDAKASQQELLKEQREAAKKLADEQKKREQDAAKAIQLERQKEEKRREEAHKLQQNILKAQEEATKKLADTLQKIADLQSTATGRSAQILEEFLAIFAKDETDLGKLLTAVKQDFNAALNILKANLIKEQTASEEAGQLAAERAKAFEDAQKKTEFSESIVTAVQEAVVNLSESVKRLPTQATGSVSDAMLKAIQDGLEAAKRIQASVETGLAISGNDLARVTAMQASMATRGTGDVDPNTVKTMQELKSAIPSLVSALMETGKGGSRAVRAPSAVPLSPEAITNFEKQISDAKLKQADATAKIDALNKSITETEKASSEAAKTKTELFGDEVQALRTIYDQQKVILDIREQLVRELDPQQIENLQKSLTLEQGKYGTIVNTAKERTNKDLPALVTSVEAGAKLLESQKEYAEAVKRARDMIKSTNIAFVESKETAEELGFVELKRLRTAQKLAGLAIAQSKHLFARIGPQIQLLDLAQKENVEANKQVAAQEAKLKQAEELYKQNKISKEDLAKEQETLDKLRTQAGETQEKADEATLKIRDNIVELVKGIGDVVNTIKIMFDAADSFNKGDIFEGINQVIDGVQGVIEKIPIIGEIAGPIIDAFQGVFNVVTDIVMAIIQANVENEQWFKTSKASIAIMNTLADSVERRVVAAQNELDIQEKLNGLYEARLDMGSEQAADQLAKIAAAQQLILDIGATLQSVTIQGQSAVSLLGDVSIGDPAALANNLANVQNQILNFKATIAEADKQLEKGVGDLSVADRNRWKQAKAEAEAAMPIFEQLAATLGVTIEGLAAMPELLRQIHQDRIDELEHRKNMGEFDETTEGSHERELDFLEDKLDIQDDLLTLARAQYAEGTITQQELWRLEEERYATEKAMLDLQNESNEATSEAAERMSALIREYQKLLKLKRQETGGGTLSTAQQAELEVSKAKMIQELIAQGKSAAEIEAFLASLPQFAAGGTVPGAPGEPVAVTAHGGELILPTDVAEMVRVLLNSVAKVDARAGGANAILASPAARAVGEGIRQREAAVINISNNINVTVNQRNDFTSMDPTKAIGLLGGAFEDELTRRVNRGVESGKIDLRRY